MFGTEFDVFKKDIESAKEQSDLLKELKVWRKRGPIRKLYNVVTYICRSLQRRERFKNIRNITAKEGDLLEREQFDYLSLKADNATR